MKRGWLFLACVLFLAWGVPFILWNYQAISKKVRETRARELEDEYVTRRWKTDSDVLNLMFSVDGNHDSLIARLNQKQWPIYLAYVQDAEYRGDSLHFESSIPDIHFSVYLEKSAQIALESYHLSSSIKRELMAPDGGLVLYLDSFQIVSSQIWAQGIAKAAMVPNFYDRL